MTTGKKTALSLLISVIVFSLSAIFLYSGVFEKIETRFYQPAIIKGLVENLNTVEKSLDEYHRLNFLRFGDFLSKESVKKSFLPSPGQKAITERNEFAGKLFEQNPGLKGIRFIDFQGRGVHYSTYKDDVLAINKNVTAFKNYDQLDTSVRYQDIIQDENSRGELFLDSSKEEILYLLPFIDNYNAYQGTAVFYVSVRDLENFLVTRNHIKLGENLLLYNSRENNLKGLVKSLSIIGKKLIPEIQNLDINGIPGNTSFADENGNNYMLLTVKNSPYGIFTGEIVNDDLFLFPDSAKNLLLVTILVTVFLAFFLLFNIKQDSYSLIHQRIIELEKEIIREYISHKDILTWDKLLGEIESKKNVIAREIKKSLGSAGWKKHGTLVDTYFNESWDELLSVLWEKKQNSEKQEGINEIKKMLEEMLSKWANSKAWGTAENRRQEEPVPVSRAPQQIETEELPEAEEPPLPEELEELPEAEDPPHPEEAAPETKKPLAETIRELDEIPSLFPEKKEPVPEVSVTLDIGNINFSPLDNIKNTLVPEKTEYQDIKGNRNKENGEIYTDDSEIPEIQEVTADNKSWSFWLDSGRDFPDLSNPQYGVTEELEVVGDGEEYAELLELDGNETKQEAVFPDEPEENTDIILKDGVYQINPRENKAGMKINEDFLNLVNSIMKKSPL